VTPLRVRTLLLTALCVGVASWVVLDALDHSGRVLPVSWTAPLALVVLAALVLGAGWPVRQWNRGRRDRPLDPLRAARALGLARAAGVTGAVLAGAYAGMAAVLAPTLDIEPRRERLLLALGAAVAGALLAGCGVLVERWCRLPPSDDDAPGGPASQRRADPDAHPWGQG
jgi:Protein of unknown function (DUF3180)